MLEIINKTCHQFSRKLYIFLFLGMSSSSPKKKHKHKHKKHKKSKKEHHHQARIVEGDYPRREKEKGRDRPEEGRAVKLKIKLGGKTLATTQ